jgi:hypothetical protein
MVALLLMLNLAAAAPPEPEPEPEELEVVDVYKDLEVEAAKKVLIDSLKEVGYRREARKKNYIRLRHDQTWKGEVRIYDDGWVVVKRQPLRFEAPPIGRVEKNSPLAWAACVMYPHMCINPYGPLVSKARFQAVETRTVGLMAETSRTLAEAVADAAIAEASNLLPARLDALWQDGQPLVGDARLENYTGRRQALLSYWDTRTETEWGDQIRMAVASFIRAEVQQSDHPFTSDEVQEFAVRRICLRGLDFGNGVVLPPVADSHVDD